MSTAEGASAPAKNHVCWFELYVEDMQRAKRFYEEAFAVNFEDMSQPNMEMWRFNYNPQGYGAAGALIKMEGMAPGGGGTMVYFSCANCEQTQEQIVAAGGKILKPAWSIGEYGTIAIAQDSEGNCIGLHND